jgi:glycosyltransferase involved in cell wall biosynthesis
MTANKKTVKPVVYIKTHKTASTLVRNAVEEYADIHGLSKLIPPPEEQSNFVCNMSADYLASLEPAYGVSARHIAYDRSFFNKLIPDAVTISSIREPLDRAVSHYYYLHPDRRSPDFPDFNYWYAANLDAPVSSCPSQRDVHAGFDNYMTRWLGLSGGLDETALRKVYDLICVQERMDLSLKLLSEILGFRVKNERIRGNEKNRYQDFRVSEEIARVFKERNALDYELYESGNRILDTEDYDRVWPVSMQQEAGKTPWFRKVPVLKSLLPQSRVATPKIIGLLPARNEEEKIGFALQALAKFTDAIVFLDDCSTDKTVQVVSDLSEVCRVEEIIEKPVWYRDEPGDRNRLLAAGRALGGTHFVVIDADEAFTANCLEGQFLKKQILSLKPREQLALRWVHLWRSVDHYRVDAPVWSDRYKRCIFCDDGKSEYKSKFIHTSRIPKMKGKRIKLEREDMGLLHFQFVDWPNLELKQRWYRWLERIRDPEKTVEAINKKYARSVDESGLLLAETPESWFEGYAFFDRAVFDIPDNWRVVQMREWQKEYGEEYFDGLA